MRKLYRQHNGEWVSENENMNADDYPEIEVGRFPGPFDELDRAEEQRDRDLRVIAGWRATR